MQANRKRTQLQAYFAGILDGEGHFGIHYNNKEGARHRTLAGHVHVTMTDPEVVVLLKREYPEGTVRRQTRSRGDRPCFTFDACHYKSERLLQDVLPFLVVKREQAQVLLSFLAHRRREHQRGKLKNLPYRECSRCVHFYECLREIRKRVKGVNSVNALLDHGLREYRAKREDVEQDVAFGVALLSSLEGVETSAEGSITQ